MKSRWIFAPFLSAWAVILLLYGLQQLDAAYPPDLSVLAEKSVVVNDRNGDLLRGFATSQGRWRLPVEVGDVDPRFINMLLGYEDKRFYSHFGSDPLAMLRAGWQLITNGRIVSGGSTITMQVARLLEGPQKRSVTTKIRQILRALQIERRLSKREILKAYLMLAPYGGNLEGIRAATLAYFGKEPKVLNPAEAALLVALPQSPEMRRPDRFAKRAIAARNRVLARLARQKIIPAFDAERAAQTRIPGKRRPLPAFAAHMTGKWRGKAERLTIDRARQQLIEALVRDEAKKLGDKTSVAVLVVEHATGEVIASIASRDFFNKRLAGEIDMTRAVRSPGSTLKPFIYGLAFEQGVVHPQSLIDDTPQDFDGYRPRNFDMGYQGTVKVAEALQLSLNIPAIRLLDAVGPENLVSRFKRGGVSLKLPTGEKAGLAIGLGGAGISLHDLVQLYTALPNGGVPVGLREVVDSEAEPLQRMISKVASWYVMDVLTGVPAPAEAAISYNIAYKTGTSYGYRDAWSVGFDGKYVVGVWVGRPDGASVPGITGHSRAAPVLFEVFSKLEKSPAALPIAPQGVLQLTTVELPKVLHRFSAPGRSIHANVEPVHIVYPPQGANVDLGLARKGRGMPLFLKLQGGKPPFRWLANGRPIKATSRRRRAEWLPDSPGYSKLTVVDSIGQTARVSVFLQ